VGRVEFVDIGRDGAAVELQLSTFDGLCVDQWEGYCSALASMPCQLLFLRVQFIPIKSDCV
jgi:hypothetical protein